MKFDYVELFKLFFTYWAMYIAWVLLCEEIQTLDQLNWTEFALMIRFIVLGLICGCNDSRNLCFKKIYHSQKSAPRLLFPRKRSKVQKDTIHVQITICQITSGHGHSIGYLKISTTLCVYAHIQTIYPICITFSEFFFFNVRMGDFQLQPQKVKH